MTQAPQSPPLPKGKPAVPAARATTPTPPRAASATRVAFGDVKPQGHRIVLYGPGGIGKTTAACCAPGPTAIFDLDESLHVIRQQLPEELAKQINSVDRRLWVNGWQGIRDTLHMDGWDEIQTIIVDSGTKAEEMATDWVLKNVKHEKDGVVIRRIEDYGFGKGYRHIYDTFATLLCDLDQHARSGRNVIMICHECTASVPNPMGEDWIRYEPRLQHSDKNSIRLRVKEWADHLLFVGYDIRVGEDGKGDSRSGSTRTVYPVERPHCMAKSRTLADQFPLDKFDPAIWQKVLGLDGQG